MIQGWKNLELLSKHHCITVLPTDKINRLDMCNTDNLDQMVIKAIDEDPAYRRLPYSCIKNKNDEVNQLLKDICLFLSLGDKAYLSLTCSDPNPARIQVNIKDHKSRNELNEYPIRVIVSIHGTPQELIDKWCSLVLGQLLPLYQSYIDNSKSCRTRIESFRTKNVKSNKIDVFSLDVAALFPSVPVIQAIPVVVDMLNYHKDKINCLVCHQPCMNECCDVFVLIMKLNGIISCGNRMMVCLWVRRYHRRFPCYICVTLKIGHGVLLYLIQVYNH